MDTREIIIENFSKPGTLSELSVTFDNSVSNYYPAEGTISFKASHETVENLSLIEISFADEFRFA